MLRLPKPSAPLAGLPSDSNQSQSPETAVASPTIRRASLSTPKGKQRDLSAVSESELQEMLTRTRDLLASTSVPSSILAPGSKLQLHREALETELKHRRNDAGLARTRLDEADELNDAMHGLTASEKSPARELHDRLRQQPALDRGRMRGLAMDDVIALESDAAARRRAATEQLEFTNRMMDDKFGVHREPLEIDYPENEDAAVVDYDEPDEYESSRGFGFGAAWSSGYSRAADEHDQ